MIGFRSEAKNYGPGKVSGCRFQAPTPSLPDDREMARTHHFTAKKAHISTILGIIFRSQFIVLEHVEFMSQLSYLCRWYGFNENTFQADVDSRGFLGVFFLIFVPVT